MEPVVVTCDKCGSDALVHHVRYHHRDGAGPDVPAAEHVLLSVERELECPVCGQRIQVETIGEA